MAGKITCQRIADVNWTAHPEPLNLQQNDVHIWRVNNVADDSLIGKYEHLLNSVESEKANRFFKTEDKHRYIITRAALRIILSKYLQIAAESIVFELGENKKPQLAGVNKWLCFNVSHSGNYRLIGISRFDLGIDIEFINNQFTYTDIVNNYFNKKEADLITSSVDSAQSFFTCWTRKEAILKAISSGLNSPLQSVPCTDGVNVVGSTLTDKNWIVQTFNVDQMHIAGAAFNEATKAVLYFNLQH